MAATISLCMIVKNEAGVLPRCLESARPWVDEIVVVDTGSSDDTIALARAHGARVVEWAWRDDFAAARNESLRHATGTWILVLDADETLSEGSGAALREACAEAPADVVGYRVKIICPREGDGGLVRLNWFPRLFRNLPGVRFEGVIHEQVVGSLARHGRLARSAVEVLHRGYTVSPEQMTAKAERNIALLGRQLDQDPTYAPGWFQLAETYVLLGRLDEAIDAYRRCLRLLDLSSLTLPAGVIAVALQNLGAALLARGNRDDGVAMLERALTVDPDLAPAHVHLGNLAVVEGDWAAAERHFTAAIEVAGCAGDRDEYDVTPWLVHFLRGCAQARQTKYDEALLSFDAALALNPEHRDSLWLLALTAAHASQWGRALGALDRLVELGRDDFPLRAQRAHTLAMLNRYAEAGAAALGALALEPASAPLLALAAENLARAGQAADAAALYARLADLRPDTPAPLLALAQCREAAGDRAGMMAAYRRAVALAPHSPEVLFALGSACLRSGALDVATDCLRGAVAGEPARADYRLNLVLCLIKRGDIREAGTALRAILARWPGLPQAEHLGELLDRLAGTGLAVEMP